MDKKKRKLKAVTTDAENREYLWKVFTMMKLIENSLNTNKKNLYGDTALNSTDLRLVSEIIYAKGEGKRLISTQLATRLGVTRSAISQIVNKLENAGVLCRVPDDVDRKIAYVELTEKAADKFVTMTKEYSEFIGLVVAEFGVSRFEKLLSLVEEFCATVQEVR